VISQSDDKFVERVRGQFLARRRWGIVLLVLGALFIGGALWAASFFEAKVLDIVSRLDSTKASALSEATDNLAFALGLKIGATITALSLGGVTACVHGLYLLFGARKERLLLRYYDEIEGLKHKTRA
jgi:hypothetical protein